MPPTGVVLDDVPDGAAERRMAQAERDRRFDEPGLVAAVEALAGEAIAVEGPAADEAYQGVGELDFPSRTDILTIEHREQPRFQDVAPDDSQPRRRLGRLRLFDESLHLDQLPVLATR